MRKANDGKKGGYLKGQSHQECNDDTGCGIRAVVTDAGGKPVELEGDEVILTKKAMADEGVYEIKGTPKEIASYINNKIGGGVKFDDAPDSAKKIFRSGGEITEDDVNSIRMATGGKIKKGDYIVHVSDNKSLSKITEEPMHFGTLEQSYNRSDALNYGNNARYYKTKVKKDWKIYDATDKEANILAKDLPTGFDYDAIRYENEVEGEGTSYIVLTEEIDIEPLEQDDFYANGGGVDSQKAYKLSEPTKTAWKLMEWGSWENIEYDPDIDNTKHIVHIIQSSPSGYISVNNDSDKNTVIEHLEDAIGRLSYLRLDKSDWDDRVKIKVKNELTKLHKTLTKIKKAKGGGVDAEIKVYRGEGRNYREGLNKGLIWVTENRESAEDYASKDEKGNLMVKSMVISKPKKPYRFQYTDNTYVTTDNIANVFRRLLRKEVESKAINVDEWRVISDKIKQYSKIGGENTEPFHTKINKPETNEIVADIFGSMGYDAVLIQEEGYNNYGLIGFKDKKAKGGDVISDKVKFLIKEEGYPKDQATAIAYSMHERGELALGGGVSQSILNSKLDLLGDEKHEGMSLVKYDDEIRVDDDLLIKGINTPNYIASFRGYDKDGNFVVYRKDKGDQMTIKNKNRIIRNTSNKRVVGGDSIESIEYLIEGGIYDEWIKEGRISQSDVSKIIESAGLNSDKKAKGGGVDSPKGDCYVIAGQVAMGITPKEIDFVGTPYVVHGEVTGQGAIEGLKYGHAWIEDDENVYDWSNGRELEFPKAIYYMLGGIEDEDGKLYRYTFDEARGKMLDTGHYGSWDLKTKL